MKIELSHISKYYQDGDKSAKGLEDVSLSFETDSSFVVVTGESGAGKSTLFHVLTGTLDFDDGEITFNDKPISGLSDEEKAKIYRENIAFDFQEYNLVEGFTPMENIVLSLTKAGFGLKEARKKANEVLDQVGLSKQKKMRVAKLSGGERQRVAIARCLASEAKILLFDEPTGNLDPDTSKEIVELIRKLQGGRLILFITHDFSLVKDYATRHIVLKDGKVEKDTLLKSPSVQEDHPEETVKHPTPKRATFYAASLFAFRRPLRLFVSFLVLLIACAGIYFGCYGIVELQKGLGETGASSTIGTGFGNEISYAKRDAEAADLSLGDEYFFDNGDLLSYFGKLGFIEDPDAEKVSTSKTFFHLQPASPISISRTFYTASEKREGFPLNLYFSTADYSNFRNTHYYSDLKEYFETDIYLYPQYESSPSAIGNVSDELAEQVKAVFSPLHKKAYISHIYFSDALGTSNDGPFLLFEDDSDFRSYYSVIQQVFLQLSKMESEVGSSGLSSMLDAYFGYPASISVEVGDHLLTRVIISEDALSSEDSEKLVLSSSLESDFDNLIFTYGNLRVKGSEYGKENVCFLDNMNKVAFTHGFSRLYELRMQKKTVGRIYAQSVEEAVNLAESYNSSPTYQLTCLEATHTIYIRNGTQNLFNRIVFFLVFLAVLLASYFLLKLVQHLLGRFYYRKGADEKVLSDIGYTQHDMMILNMIQFISLMTVCVLIVHIVPTLLIPGAASDYVSKPYVYIIGILLSFFTSIYISRPTRKRTRKERHHD